MKTSSEQRYLIAKFAPDIRRYEPKNIGVILWAAKTVGVKFLPENEVPFIEDKAIYRRWISHWTDKASQESLKPRRGEAVPRTTSDFLDVLMETQKDNFVLNEGGIVAEPLTKRQIPSALRFLFDELVIDPTQTSNPLKDSQHRLSALCKKVFEFAGLEIKKDIVRRRPLECRFGRGKREFKPEFTQVSNNQTIAIFHTARLSSAPSIDSTSFMFEQIQKRNIIPKDRCAVFVYEKDPLPPIDGSIEQLSEFAEVIDVFNPRQAATLALKVSSN